MRQLVTLPFLPTTTSDRKILTLTPIPAEPSHPGGTLSKVKMPTHSRVLPVLWFDKLATLPFLHATTSNRKTLTLHQFPNPPSIFEIMVKSLRGRTVPVRRSVKNCCLVPDGPLLKSKLRFQGCGCSSKKQRQTHLSPRIQ
jgi:hypothetical protein